MKTDSIFLNTYNWKAFFLEDVVSINSGKRLTKANITLGEKPFIGASDKNNGITAFTSIENESEDRNVLGVNYNGSVCCSFYHPYTALFSDDVKRLKWKDIDKNNKYTLLFLSVVIQQQKSKFTYGYKFNAQRMKRQKILLPICSDGTIDWNFMEDFMRLKEKSLLELTIKKLDAKIKDCKFDENEIKNVKWKNFKLTDVFPIIQRGKRLKKANHIQGCNPYVSSSSLNNGIDGFVGNEDNVRIFKECITIANSGSVGSTFFHEYEFVASDHVTQLKREGIDKYAYLFMLPIINRLSEKYGFNREINDSRIKREQIMLPITAEGELDFNFMSNYMKFLKNKKLKEAFNKLQTR